MEVGTALGLHFTLNTHILNRISKPKTSSFTLSSSSSSSSSNSSTVYSFRSPKPKRDFLADWVSQNDDVVRPLPIYVGTASLFAVLFNRTISGIAPVADAGSSQSRADLLTLGLAVTNILAGLVWLSIKPKSITVVNPQGVECKKLSTALPDAALTELLWVWESLSDVTCCRSLVIVYESSCVLQFGFAAESSPGNGEAVSVDTNKVMQGSVYQGVMKSGTQSYLANLSLYPGKSELPFLPSNTQVSLLKKALALQACPQPLPLPMQFYECETGVQPELMVSFVRLQKYLAVILQPLGDKGIAIIGGDTIRGFTTSDQAWITFIGEKLDSTLAKYVKQQQTLT